MPSLLARFFGLANNKHAALPAYNAIVTAARNPALYEACDLEDSVETRFELLVLHVFLVLHTLRSTESAAPFRQQLFNTMVGDLDENLREMGVGDMSVGKKVKGLAEIFYGRVKQYKEALENNTLETTLAEIYKQGSTHRLAGYVQASENMLTQQAAGYNPQQQYTPAFAGASLLSI